MYSFSETDFSRIKFYIFTASVFMQEWNMGQRASDTRGVTFEDVRVPKEVSLASLSFCCVARNYFMENFCTVNSLVP